MSGQTKISKIENRGINLPGLEAFKKVVSDKEISHAGKPTQSFHFLQNSSFERSAIVERYDREYKVIFSYYSDDNEVSLISIDGNPDIEDTYNIKFLKAMIEGALESLEKEENHNSYNDLYEGE